MVNVRVCVGGQGWEKVPFGGLCRCGTVFGGKTVASRKLYRKKRKKSLKTSMQGGRVEEWKTNLL